MTTISITDAQQQLAALVGGLGPHDEIVITDGQQPVARLLPPDNEAGKSFKRRLGTAVGELFIVAEDDEHLKDFQEYMY